MKITATIALPLVLVSRCFAADLAVTLMPAQGRVVAGETAAVDLVALNPGTLDEPFAAPPSLLGRIDTANGSWPLQIEALGAAPVAVPPGGFAARHYRFVVPAAVAGRAVLTVTPANGPEVNAVFYVSSGEAKPAEPAVTPLGRFEREASAASLLARSFAGRFMPNQPVYFVYGSGSEQAAKFQFSFDYRLATWRQGEPGGVKLTTLRFGYTQRSLWDFNANSSPFYDTSYMPELAINTDSPSPHESSSGFTWMGWRGGFLHESNGRAGDDSRSLNVLYFRPRFVIGSIDSWVLVMLPELQAYVGDVSNNSRIKDYRGYGRLRMYFGRNDGPALQIVAWTGRHMDHPSCQLDFSCPMHASWLQIDAYFLAQYFTGYGESLRDYDQKSDALRIGFSLVR